MCGRHESTCPACPKRLDFCDPATPPSCLSARRDWSATMSELALRGALPSAPANTFSVGPRRFRVPEGIRHTAEIDPTVDISEKARIIRTRSVTNLLGSASRVGRTRFIHSLAYSAALHGPLGWIISLSCLAQLCFFPLFLFFFFLFSPFPSFCRHCGSILFFSSFRASTHLGDPTVSIACQDSRPRRTPGFGPFVL